MVNTLFFTLLIVLILSVLYVMKGSDNPRETGYNQTPKQYIEQKKAARQAAEQMEQALKKSSEQADKALEASRNQR
jgi:sugar phosphate permease